MRPVSLRLRAADAAKGPVTRIDAGDGGGPIVPGSMVPGGRDRMERETGFEPATLSLGSRSKGKQ